MSDSKKKLYTWIFGCSKNFMAEFPIIMKKPLKREDAK